MRSSTFKIAALAAATTLTLAACGGGGESTDSGSGGEEGGSEPLTIGVKIDQPGLGVQDGDSYSGMDVDVARAVAEQLGVSEDDITFQEAPTPQRENLLTTNQVDMIFATYSITDERKEQVQFAGPYFVAGQDLLVAADSDIAGPEDLDGQILCSVTGSTSATNVQEEVPGVQLQEYGRYSECVEQLANGTIDALTTDDTILAGYAAQDQYAGQLKVVGNTFSEENYGVGLNKDSDRCEEINEILQGLWDDGTMEQIISDNLGAADYTPNADLNPPEIGGHCG
ncbi:glutamate ABC transporter substrate-binding protein [Serinicoccus kebangsaanensis]|uniref:glutamate ABC transporter substrate-binding protein n=1 Tax=Serinicoccus kebangsaanensis TaxID=2602069 RepID=UPI00124DEEDB|nr:glutamate ABC transporter substrate-binding protein [Serinicoccus kebangsaanensis]